MAAEEEFSRTISEQGFGKRSSVYGYRLTGRGGKGIWAMDMGDRNKAIAACFPVRHDAKSEEHTSELQSLMRISYAVFCFKKKNKNISSIINKQTYSNYTETHHTYIITKRE